jgi:hypothetical protein
MQTLHDFLPGLSLNRSITKLIFDGWDFDRIGQEGGEERWWYNSWMTLFSNQIVTSLQLENVRNVENLARRLLLSQFDSLKEFTLDFDWYGEGPAKPIIYALIGHTGLNKLLIHEGTTIHPLGMGIKGYNTGGFTGLEKLLRNPTTHLESIDLKTHYVHRCSDILARGIWGNSSLKEIKLDFCGNEDGDNRINWEAILNALQRSRC